MGVVDDLADGEEEAKSKAHFYRIEHSVSRTQVGFQRQAPHELHGEEMFAGVGAARVVDGADPRMIETREGLDLALEHREIPVVHEASAPDDLESDEPMGLLLLGLVHDPHPS